MSKIKNSFSLDAPLTLSQLKNENQQLIYHENVRQAILVLMDYIQNSDTAESMLTHIGSGGQSHAQVSTALSGFMSVADKLKLDSLSNYQHPLAHSATIIEETEDRQFISKAKLLEFENKLSSLQLGTTSTTAHRGDLGNLAYKHSLVVHAPVDAQPNSAITKDEIESKLVGLIVSHTHKLASSNTDGLMAKADKAKLDKIKTNFLYYTHPLTHPASMIEQTTEYRFVTDTQIANWGQAYLHSQTTHAPTNAQKNSDITKAEIEAKLIGTVTSHGHSASVITQTSTARFVTDVQISSWNAKSTLALGITSTTAYRGDYGNTAYTHSQAAHAPVGAQPNADITKAEIEAKLVGSITSHTHDAANIVQAASYRFVTDTQIANWNNSVTKTGVSEITGTLHLTTQGVGPLFRTGLPSAYQNVSWGSTSVPHLSVHSNSNGSAFTVARYTADGAGAALNLAKSRSTVVGEHGAVLSNDILATINFCGALSSDQTAAGQTVGTQIVSKASQDWTPTAAGSYLGFFTTAKNSLVRTETMRLQDDGTALINKTTDDLTGAKLQVNGLVSGTKPATDNNSNLLATTSFIQEFFEEGTLPGAYICSSLSPDVKIFASQHSYKRKNNSVTVSLYFTWAAYPGVLGPIYCYGGTPITPKLNIISVGNVLAQNIVFTGNIVCYINGGTNIILKQNQSGGNYVDINMVNNGRLIITIEYEVL